MKEADMVRESNLLKTVDPNLRNRDVDIAGEDIVMLIQSIIKIY